MVRHRVIFLPGGVLPAGPAYAALMALLGDDADARVKDLELYATPFPPPDYSLATEVARLVADAGLLLPASIGGVGSAGHAGQDGADPCCCGATLGDAVGQADSAIGGARQDEVRSKQGIAKPGTKKGYVPPPPPSKTGPKTGSKAGR